MNDKSQKTPEKPIDGYQLLRDSPELREAVERMARVKIVFEEEGDEGKNQADTAA